jgi:hypothetical protein
MERVLGPYLRGGGARAFNFQALSQDLLAATLEIPFSVPPYMSLLARVSKGGGGVLVGCLFVFAVAFLRAQGVPLCVVFFACCDRERQSTQSQNTHIQPHKQQQTKQPYPPN